MTTTIAFVSFERDLSMNTDSWISTVPRGSKRSEWASPWTERASEANERSSERPSGPFKTRLSRVTRNRPLVVGEAKRHLEINIDTNIPTGQSNCGGGLTWASWCKKPTKNHLKISAPRDCLWPVIRTENGENSKYSKIGQYWMPPLEPLQATMSSNVGVNNNLRLGWRYSKKQETKFPTGSLGCGGQSW